jgi:hypothetical protein
MMNDFADEAWNLCLIRVEGESREGGGKHAQDGKKLHTIFLASRLAF